MSAFSQWRAAASNSDLAVFLADTALVRTTLADVSKQQAAAVLLAKSIADKTEAGAALYFLLATTAAATADLHAGPHLNWRPVKHGYYACTVHEHVTESCGDSGNTSDWHIDFSISG